MLLVSFALMCFSGCGDGPSTPSGTRYANLDEIVTALACKDFESKDVSPTATDDISIGPEMRSAAGECNYLDKPINLDLFADTKHLNQYLAVGATIGCAMAKGFGISEIYQAVGPNWIATADDNLDKTTTEQIAETLHGEPHHVKC